MLKTILSYIVFFSLLCGTIFPQDKKLDSLYRSLKRHSSDTSGVRTYLKISRNWINKGKYDSASIYARKAQALSKKLSFTKGLASSCNFIGQVFNYYGDFDSSLWY